MDLRNVLEPDLMVMRSNHKILTACLSECFVFRRSLMQEHHPKKEGAALLQTWNRKTIPSV
jgi:hypothetical protein